MTYVVIMLPSTMRKYMMSTKSSDFSASVAHFRAVADAKLTRLRQSAQYESLLNGDAVEAFTKVEGSVYAGASGKRRKCSLG